MPPPSQRPQRKSSISSISSSRSRQPRSLRLPSGLSRVSIPSLSLVFAHGDSSLPSPDAIPPPLRRPGATSSLSEEALTRQLDRDTGGERMGLRSRRSSSATVNLAGKVPSSPSPSSTPDVMEEDEDENQAGPSVIQPSPAAVPSDAQTDGPKLNPKRSASWLRWAAPAPSFPKAQSIKGKGKEVETITETPAEAIVAALDPIISSLDIETQAPIPPNQEEVKTEQQLGSISPPKTISRGWFSRNPPIIKEMEKEISPAKIPPTPQLADTPITHDVLHPDPVLIPPTSSSGPEPAIENLDNSGPKVTENAEQVTGGWSRFIWGTGSPTQTTKPSMNQEPPSTSMETEPVVEEPPVIASVEAIPELPSSEEGSAVITHPANNQHGWSSYLYSIIIPQVDPPRSEPEAPPLSIPTVVAADPTLEQKPVETSMPPPPAPTVSVEAATPDRPDVTTTSSSRTASPIRRMSTTPSTSGWLNYLALRATQKKIGAPSIRTGNSESEPRRSIEEVMDLEGDPNFPAASEAAADKVKPDSKSVKVEPKANLAMRKKRLSNSSVPSSPSPAISSSPKARSILDVATTPSSPSSSGLPPPPKPSSVQPNFIIPTFSTTFDRPPRSLPPLASVDESKGITAATTGLAWKAIGAVGSYVYTAPKIEDDKETRGKREGRRVGSDLPRRTGLVGGSEDDGWKSVKRVVVVGVHGWFPAKMLNSVIGEPTGTSTKFATMMGQSVKQFFHEKGVTDLHLTLIPLEGEGTIDNRVDKLYKAYLSNPAWIDSLRQADAIFFAAHSQGCIVTTHLISRLIAQGHIRTALNGEAIARCEWAFGPVGLVPNRQRRKLGTGSERDGYQKVAMLAMCGVHLGPLYSISTSNVIQPYLQWFENAAARELFEFQDTTSAVSQAYQKALSMILENEVRVLLLASLNDQVVPIYGSSFSSAKHPLLLRALFVDGASYTASDFMTNLLCFAFMLRNAGIDDQGLVEHLSEATAGSLTGVGHSSPYEEAGCYNLAVQYLFHSGPAAQPVPPLSVDPFSARDARNDFELPWIMRALVDSPEVKDLFPGELRDLKEGIISWKPTTKALKEIKKRLEPMAGRQSRLRPLQSSPSSASLASTPGDGASPAAAKTLGKQRSRL